MDTPTPGTAAKGKKKPVITPVGSGRLIRALKALGLLGVGAIGGAALTGDEEEPYDPFAAQIQRYQNPYV